MLQDRDPRWLVQPREDGTNVNGWHWQDKNRFSWAKDKLEQALPELPPAETGNVRIVKVTDVVGEVSMATCIMSASTMVHNISCDSVLLLTAQQLTTGTFCPPVTILQSSQQKMTTSQCLA